VHEKELEPHKIDMAVPLSPDQLSLKMRSIHQHQSQSTQVLISEDRNRQMARLYDHFGLAEYEAIEVFQRWRLM
jgi:glucosamine-6-phosphate deaminase